MHPLREGQTAGGHWLEQEKEEHINVLELKAILFGLQSLVYEQEVRVGVFTDKTRVLAYVRNMGRVRSP